MRSVFTIDEPLTGLKPSSSERSESFSVLYVFFFNISFILKRTFRGKDLSQVLNFIKIVTTFLNCRGAVHATKTDVGDNCCTSKRIYPQNNRYQYIDLWHNFLYTPSMWERKITKPNLICNWARFAYFPPHRLALQLLTNAKLILNKTNETLKVDYFVIIESQFSDNISYHLRYIDLNNVRCKLNPVGPHITPNQ